LAEIGEVYATTEPPEALPFLTEELQGGAQPDRNKKPLKNRPLLHPDIQVQEVLPERAAAGRQIHDKLAEDVQIPN
jgi:hypothetical protein